LRLCLRRVRLRLRRRRSLGDGGLMSLISSIQTRLSRIFLAQPGIQPPAAGVYHYRKEIPGAKARLHLRLEPDGRGLLLVNAARAFQLNPTAARMAYLSLEGISTDQAVKALNRWYNAPGGQLSIDYAQLCAQLEMITDPGEHCPICELDLETTMPFSSQPSAPYRMDLALTYRCNNECEHCYNARSRRHPELTTAEWKHILDRLWQAGIPHVVFTGGEPTLRTDLPELIAHAEANGQITGLNTNGRRLKDPAFVQALADARLDHVQITLESHDAEIHDRMVAAQGAWGETVEGIRNALRTNLYVMTNTTLLTYNSPGLSQTLDFLAELGVPTIGLNALIYSGHGAEAGTGLPESSLPGLLETAREITGRTGQRLIWYTPTRYCEFDPLLLDLGVKGCTAALYAMCVEPDGAVLPCQSYYQPLGRLPTDTWQSIWEHPLAVSLRERRDVPTACRDCTIFDTCGGGCPLSRQAHPELLPKPILSSPVISEVR
jgi:radical SAM protein with 4Fe4S-binding SPASM domain